MKRVGHALERAVIATAAPDDRAALQLVPADDTPAERNNDSFLTFGWFDVATCVLDPERNLQFFTRSAQDLLGIEAEDVGKPFARVALSFDDRELATDIAKVMIDGAPIERIVHACNGRWYKRSVFSYLSDGHATAGIVLSFLDVTENKRAAERLDRLTTRERAVIEEVVAGHSNKVIAFKLAISRRTVEHHRQRAMSKLSVATLAALIRLFMLASLRLFVTTIYN